MMHRLLGRRKGRHKVLGRAARRPGSRCVADRSSGVLVGATAAGPAAGEVLGLLVLAVHARVAIPDLRRMIFAYPTFHRAIEDALRDLDT